MLVVYNTMIGWSLKDKETIWENALEKGERNPDKINHGLALPRTTGDLSIVREILKPKI